MAVPPLDNNITVLNRGKSKGLIGSIPAGGHRPPNSIPTPKTLTHSKSPR